MAEIQSAVATKVATGLKREGGKRSHNYMDASFNGWILYSLLDLQNFDLK